MRCSDLYLNRLHLVHLPIAASYSQRFLSLLHVSQASTRLRFAGLCSASTSTSAMVDGGRAGCVLERRGTRQLRGLHLSSFCRISCHIMTQHLCSTSTMRSAELPLHDAEYQDYLRGICSRNAEQQVRPDLLPREVTRHSGFLRQFVGGLCMCF